MTTQLDFSPIELANEYHELRWALKLDETMEMMTEDCTVEFPAIPLFGATISKGKAEVLAMFKEEEKGGLPTLKNVKPFQLAKDCQRVVERTMEGSKYFFTLKIKQTIWFNKEGKVSKMTLKKL